MKVETKLTAGAPTAVAPTGVVPSIRIPSLDRLLGDPVLTGLARSHGRAVVTQALREVTADARSALLEGRAAASDADSLVRAAAERLERWMRPAPTRVFNLTGTVLHTNLGRAPLPEEAQDAMRLAAGTCSVEYDLDAGTRGSRDADAGQWLQRLTGAEDAVVVNNNAAAVLLVLNTFAARRQVVVSRGELVEIGGSFRMPDIMRSAGTRLVEVGSTNRTHAADYEAAVNPKTAMLMKVSTSNFEICGFTATVATQELARISHRHGLLTYSELGSGALVDLRDYGLPYEPTPQDALRSGADLVSFSADKLLGGPQAGIVLGSRVHVARLRRNPLLRALRLDKTRLAALSAVLRLYADPQRLRQRLPTLRLLSRPPEEIEAMATSLVAPLRQALAPYRVDIDVVSCASQVGSGAHPMHRLPSHGIRLSGKGKGPSAATIASRLRTLPLPIVGRIEKDGVVLDLRCLEACDRDEFLAQIPRLKLEEKWLR